LRIHDIIPDPDFYPCLSRIPYLGSRKSDPGNPDPIKATKEERETIGCQKYVLGIRGTGYEIRKKPLPDPGSRPQGMPDPQYCLLFSIY
jgi:hypothetical protein